MVVAASLFMLVTLGIIIIIIKRDNGRELKITLESTRPGTTVPGPTQPETPTPKTKLLKERLSLEANRPSPAGEMPGPVVTGEERTNEGVAEKSPKAVGAPAANQPRRIEVNPPAIKAAISAGPDSRAFVVDGDWRVEDGVLIQRNMDPREGKAAIILLGDTPLSNFDLSFTAQVLEGDRFNALFQFTDQHTGWVVESGDQGGRDTSLWNPNGGDNPVHRVKFPVEQGIDYKMLIEVRPMGCRVSRDGKLVLKYQHKDIKRGRVGLGSWRSKVIFKDIMITTPAPEKRTLWEGPPRIVEAAASSAKVVIGPSRPTAPDPLQAGSVWVTEPGGFVFRVLERQGVRLKALFEVGWQRREVNGTVENGRLRWLAKDVQAISGSAGDDNEGEIRGDEIAMSYSRSGGPIIGQFILRRRIAETESVAGPGRDSLGGTPVEPARRALKVHGAGWSVVGNQLLKEEQDIGTVSFGNEGWTDFDLTYEVFKSAGRDGFGCHFRQGDGKLYVFILGAIGENHLLGIWSKTPAVNRFLRSTPGTMRPMTWYKVKISTRGRRIRVELDDRMLFDFEDDFASKGVVALKCYNTSGRFRNIRVTDPSGAILWDGLPDLAVAGKPLAIPEATGNISTAGSK